MKRPSFQFYPADWLNDPKLKLADWEIRGLWMDLLCYMHNESHYGYLCIGDRYLDENEIQRLLNANPKRFKRVFKALKTLDIIRVDKNGFYSKRMVEDEHIRRVRAEAGTKGGNPNLLKQKDKQIIKQKQTPSSSSSSSSSSSLEDPPLPPDGGNEKKLTPFDEFYEKYPKKTTKQPSQAFWTKNRLDAKLPEILEGLNRYKVSDLWTKEKGAYVCDPIRFLTKERWRDDPEPARLQAVKRPVGTMLGGNEITPAHLRPNGPIKL